MTFDELEVLLTEWGALSKYTEARKEGGTDFHALARALDFAPGTRAKAAIRLVGRDGRDRRRLMARELELCGKRLVPMDYVDPVKGTESRKGGGVSALPARDDTPPHLRRVAEAAKKLRGIDTLKGLCLKFEYCGYGSQTDKAASVSLAMDGAPVGLRLYREQLAYAKGWMHSELARAAA